MVTAQRPAGRPGREPLRCSGSGQAHWRAHAGTWSAWKAPNPKEQHLRQTW